MGRKKGGQNPHLLCMELRRRHRTCALAHERLHEHVRLRTRAETQRLRLSTRAGTQCGRLRTSAGTHVCACARAPARNVIAHARRHTLYTPVHAHRHRSVRLRTRAVTERVRLCVRPRLAHACTLLGLDQREIVLCAPARACSGRVRVCVQRVCACARRHFLQP